jgi:hypothetical protein
MTVASQNVGVGKYDFKSKQWSHIRIDGGYLNAIYASEAGLWISWPSNINLWKNGQLATYPVFVFEGGTKIEYGVWCISHLIFLKVNYGLVLKGDFCFLIQNPKKAIIMSKLFQG